MAEQQQHQQHVSKKADSADAKESQRDTQAEKGKEEAKTPLQRHAQAQEEIAQEEAASEYKPDESPVPGGIGYAADGKTLTNNFGQRIDKNGKLLDGTPLPRD